MADADPIDGRTDRMSLKSKQRAGSRKGKVAPSKSTARKVGESNFDLVPDETTFARNYRAGVAQTLSIRIVADLETPVSVYLKLANSSPYSFLLESVEGGANRGRYSIIGMDPDLVWRATGDATELNTNPLAKPNAFRPVEKPYFDSLRELLTQSRIELDGDLPPMAAGVFGYLSYDTIRQFEHLPDMNPDAVGTSDAILTRPQLIAIFDSVRDEICMVTPVYPDRDIKPDRAYSRARARLEEAVSRLEKPLEQSAPSHHHLDEQDIPEPVSNTTPQRYAAMVKQAKRYIEAGDIFQVVLSQRFEAPFELPPFALYRALRRTNPSPFLFYLDFGDFQVVGSSPEILVRMRNNEVTIRPIAGTRYRGRDAQEDAQLAEELVNDPKERAEHLMLLDLGRNDVGRVTVPNTVRVTDSFGLEFYSQVMHIVSNVVGELRPDCDAIDALMAGFPAGTVSGAPKVRAMEIIDELEQEKRGIYAGCVGYFSADGEMDTCIALRTAVVKDSTLYAQAGAGIVADSVPKLEQLECKNKARALFRAAEEAIRFTASTASQSRQNSR